MQKIFLIDGEEVAVENFSVQGGEVCFRLDGMEYHYTASLKTDGYFTLMQHNRNRRGLAHKQTVWLHGGVEAQVEEKNRRKQSSTSQKGALHTAPMPGTIRAILVKVGDEVEAGHPLVVLEAMKLQITIEAAYAGVVEEIFCETNGQVAETALLARIARR